MASSASNQKLCRLSIVSSESYEGSIEGSVCEEHTPRVSINQLQDELQFVMSTMLSTLATQGIAPELSTSVLDSLKLLTTLVCSEFLKVSQTVREVRLEENSQQGPLEITVNLIKNNDHDLLGKVFEMPKTGLLISKKECEELAALLVGAIRDSSSHDLNQKIAKMQERLISCEQTTKTMKKKIQEKDFEIQELKEELEKLKPKTLPSKPKNYCESESTVNESF